MLVGLFALGFAINIYFSYIEWKKENRGDSAIHMLCAGGMLFLGVGAYNAL